MSWFADNKIWAVIGKLVLLTTLVIGVPASGLGIYHGLLVSKPELIGYGSYFVYVLPPDLSGILANISNLQSGKYISAVQKTLTDYKGNIEKVINEQTGPEQSDTLAKLRIEFVNIATDTLAKNILYDIFPPELSKSVNSYKGLLHFYIVNNGDVVAKEVTLKTPFDGIAYIASDSGVGQVVEVKRSIEIGSIRQQQFVRVFIWSTEASEPKHEDFFMLTHSSGIGAIQFSVSEFGLHYRILRDYLYFVVPGLLVLLYGSLMGFLLMIDLSLGTSIVLIRSRK